MARLTSGERRALSAEELELVEKSRGADLTALSNPELSRLVNALRRRGDKARDAVRRPRHRGSDGASPGVAGTGTEVKADLLAAAVRRLQREVDRRRRDQARRETMRNARKALALRKASEEPRHPKPGRTRRKGMKPKPNERPEPLVPPMEVGRVSQFVKNAQAKRDKR